MTSPDAGAAYAARASEYIDLFGSVAAADERDLRLVTRWAGGVRGRVVDAGCGPGHWTGHLAGLGLDVEGVDLAEPFLEHARARYPDVPFRRARLDGLGVPDGTLGGVLAWYSVIHTHPDGMDATLRELARALAPGGGLLLGFFSGPRVEPFDHAVTPAWYWPVAEMSARLAAAGFDVEASETRTDPGRRPHGAITARRRPGGAAPPA